MTSTARITERDVYRMKTHEERLEKTEYLVNSTSEECFMLWKEWHKKFEWVQTNPGFTWEIKNITLLKGLKLEKMPVVISMWWWILEGHLVCFYEGCSMVVDRRIIDNFIRPHIRKAVADGRELHTNATNFHQVINHFDLLGRKANRCPNCKKKLVGETEMDERCSDDLCWCDDGD